MYQNIRIKNNQIFFNVKPSSKFEEKESVKNFYQKLLRSKLNREFKKTFKNLGDIYGFDVNLFKLTHIKILKTLYNNPLNHEKFIYLYDKELLYLKKNKFIRYDKKYELFKLTKKSKNFLFEFNANFWLEKYLMIINKYENTLISNFNFSWNHIKMDLKKNLIKEKEYIKG